MSVRRWPPFGPWLAPALAAAAATLPLGCADLVCGQGTVERDGTCEPADEQPGPATCGEGTELGPGGTCVIMDPVECDPATTTPQYDPVTHITTCVGTNVDVCAPDLQCPTPAPNTLTLCGRIFDTETDQPVRAADASGAACNPAAPTATGPCSLSIQPYDALLFQQDPNGTAPQQNGGIVFDDCGRYVIRDIHMTSFGFIGIGIDDGMGVADTHILTGVATADAMAVPARGFRAYATRKATDTAWSSAASLGGGDTFASLGVLVMIFRHAGVPVPGVAIKQDANVVPANDYYFEDTDQARSMLDPPRAMTGPDGTGLFIHADAPVPFSGVGGEPPNCRWPQALAATIPSVVFVQLKDAESTAGGPCP
ncbi:MAG TPA: hypothetical protein VHE35_36835 [Kofleriaceae bacterium]|nr:hypothetical protein [Kofleriaceae bacterium]